MEIKEIMARVFKIMASDEEATHNGSLSTGYKELDKLMGGIHSDDLIIVAGDKRMGNAFSWNMIVNRINTGECRNSILVISPDISKEKYAMQLLSVKSGVPYSSICDASRSLTQRDWDKITLAWEPICDSNLHIYDQENITVDEIHELAMKISRYSGLDLIVVDSITSLSSKSRNQFEDDTRISRSRQLKNLAKDLNVPVLAVSDYDSIVDARDRFHRKKNNRPIRIKKMEGADLILLLNNYEANLDLTGNVEVNILENNNGQTGNLKLEYNEHSFRLQETGNFKEYDIERINSRK